MSDTSVLTEAHGLIHGDRRDDYGGPLESFSTIAALWEPILDCGVTAEQVALCLIQLKVARALHGWQRDSFVDIAGYAGCLDLIRQERRAETGREASSQREVPCADGDRRVDPQRDRVRRVVREADPLSGAHR